MLGAKLGITSKQYNILTDGLILNYVPSFNESYPGLDPSGDGIFNLASGSFTPTGSFTSTSLPGIDPSISGSGAGKFIALDGTDDWISFPLMWNGVQPTNMSFMDPIVASNEITINMWIYPNKINDGTTGILGAYDWTAGKGMFDLRQINATVSYLFIDGTSVPNISTTSDILSASTWHNLTVTYDGSNIKIYLDGDIKLTDAYSGTLKTISRRLYWGCQGGDTQAGDWDGNFGPFMVYDKALTQEEITQNYNAIKDRYTN